LFYRKALAFQETSSKILALLGFCHYRINQQAAAEEYLQQALAHAGDNLEAYDAIIRTWNDLDQPQRAWQAMAQAEAKVRDIPFEFYLFQAENCLRQRDTDLALPWIDRVMQHAPPGTPVLAMIGETATMLGELDLGREYLNKALAAGDYPGQVYLMLGVLEVKEGKKKAAEKHWKEAKRIARQTEDRELMERIDHAEIVFSGPVGWIPGMAGDAADLPFPLLDLLDDWDDEDDDDEFF
jgi:tetratricopeptide (TPR) repeat protein